jgi:hypothetical protein
MGNEPSRGRQEKKVGEGGVVAKRVSVDGELTAEQLEALDPRIREWVTNPNYTVASRAREGSPRRSPMKSGGGGRRSEGMREESKEAWLGPVGRRSADGVVTIRTGKEEKKGEEVELAMLKRLGMHMPLRYKERFRAFWPSSAPRTKTPRIELNPLETYKLLQHYQMRLNRASLYTLQVQETLYSKICGADFAIWSAAHQLASTGLALNQLETHISEAWNFEKQLVKTRLRLGAAVQSIDSLLRSLPPDLCEFLGPPPFQISPLLTHAYYLKLNYWTITPYAYDSQEFKDLEIEWLNHILPYWDVMITQPRTRQLWRRGIPPRLRAFIWQKAIGNRLFLTREMFLQHLEQFSDSLQSDPIYAKVAIEQNNGTGTPASDGTVEIDLSDPSSRTTDPFSIVQTPSKFDPQSNDTRESPSSSHQRATIGVDQTETKIASSDLQSTSDSSKPSTSDAKIDDTDGVSLQSTENVPLKGEKAVEKDAATNPAESTSVPLIAPGKKKNYKELIIRDSLRTFSKLGIYRKPRTAPHDDLVAVLHAVATHRPETGYVQGQSFLAANMLLYMPAEEAFVALANLLEHHFFKSFCLFDLPQIHRHIAAYESLLQKNLPDVAAHFKNLHLNPELYVFDWYVTLFSKPLPPPVSGLIWDCYLLEGPQFIPLITCAILRPFASRLVQFNFDECMKLLQQLPDELNIAEIIADLDSLPYTQY